MERNILYFALRYCFLTRNAFDVRLTPAWLQLINENSMPRFTHYPHTMKALCTPNILCFPCTAPPPPTYPTQSPLFLFALLTILHIDWLSIVCCPLLSVCLCVCVCMWEKSAYCFPVAFVYILHPPS